MAYIAAHIIYRNALRPRVVQHMEIEEFADTEETGVLKCKCQASAKCEFMHLHGPGHIAKGSYN